MTRLFISDLHLESTESLVYRSFQAILKHAVENDYELFILGDLVEVWLGDDDDSAFADQLRLDLKATSTHVNVSLMHGNRDFLYREKFAQDTGVNLLPDPFVLTEDGSTVTTLLTHGDAYCSSDEAYMMMRKLFRSPDWQDEILGNTLEERRIFAKNIRDKSKSANELKADNITDVVESELLEAVDSHNCQTVIHGHTHRPGIHCMSPDKKRYVLGDWNECGWVLKQTGEEFDLIRFNIQSN